MPTISLNTIASYVNGFLHSENFKDASQNGLQVQGASQIKKICTTVDVSLEAVNQCIAKKADALFVHHGFLWGKSLPITGRRAQLLKALLSNNISLLAYHLPLDAHETIGNNAQLCNYFDASLKEPFGTYHGQTIGFSITLQQPCSLPHCQKILEQTNHNQLLSFPFGTQTINKIAIVSGRAGDEQLLAQAETSNVDLYITGEFIHESFHVAKELQLNVIAAGHYATETHGIKALGEHLQEKFDIQHEFLHLPTGL